MSLDRTVAFIRAAATLTLVALFWMISALALRAQTSAVSPSAPIIRNVFWQPNQLQQGSAVFVTIELNRVPSRVSGTLIGRSLTFFKSTDNPKVWHALAGADFEAKPKTYDLAVYAVFPNGKRLHLVKALDLAAGNFKTGAVEVPEQFVQPDATQRRQIARDETMKKRAYAHLTPRPLWSGDFIKPVKGDATESFGESRILNEEMTSTHRGTDFEVKEGTPVLVSNSGTVVLANELFYEGNCVIVDHGERFFTIYMHLAKLDVHVGQKLQKGTQVGVSGATGRVSGPHLHMGVLWNGAYLNPVELLTLTLPRTTVREQ